jgi:hypothetical protein
MRHVSARTGLVAVLLLAAIPAAAQNTSFGGSVHLLVGQSPVRVTITSGNPTRYYDVPVVTGRSYCAEASASEQELNAGAASLSVFRQSTSPLGGTTDTGSTVEPKGIGASRICFISPATETMFVTLTDGLLTAGGIEYSLRVVETTLWSNWFFVAADYASWTLLRNTTNTAVTVNVTLRRPDGTSVGTPVTGQAIPGNGIYFVNARGIMACDFPTACANANGSVEVAHTGSPDAIVGSQTTLSGGQGLSFDTLFFQRRAW